MPGEQPQPASSEEKSLLSNYKFFDNMSPQAQAQDDMAYHHSLSNGIAYQQTAMKTYSNIPTDRCWWDILHETGWERLTHLALRHQPPLSPFVSLTKVWDQQHKKCMNRLSLSLGSFQKILQTVFNPFSPYQRCATLLNQLKDLGHPAPKLLRALWAPWLWQALLVNELCWPQLF